MPVKPNSTWDFKSYTERTWFRDLVVIFLLAISSYAGLHFGFDKSRSNYEYVLLNQDQMQFINRIYMDHLKVAPSPADKGSTDKNATANNPHLVTNTPNPSQTNPTTNSGAVNNNTNNTGGKDGRDTCMSKDTCPCTRVMDYLDNIFEKQLDTAQKNQVKKLLRESNPQEAVAFLNSFRFKVHSYFWLVGPCVYCEVLFWALFGVLCSLLFILGAVGSDATTDLGNPQSQFDSSEILGQIAKMLYAPLCTMTVVLGYNFIKGQNVVEIDSSKGIIVFAFIGGFYSSRVISLMDRLKDLLLPNSGSASLPTMGQGSTPSATIPQFKVQLALNPALLVNVQTVAAGPNLNNATVTMQSAGNPVKFNGSHMPNDPDGLFTFNSVTPGNYSIFATLGVTPPGSAAITLTGQQTGQIMTGIAPMTITMQ